MQRIFLLKLSRFNYLMFLLKHSSELTHEKAKFSPCGKCKKFHSLAFFSFCFPPSLIQSSSFCSLLFVLLFCKFHFTHKIKMVEWTGFSHETLADLNSRCDLLATSSEATNQRTVLIEFCNLISLRRRSSVIDSLGTKNVDQPSFYFFTIFTQVPLLCHQLITRLVNFSRELSVSIAFTCVFIQEYQTFLKTITYTYFRGLQT